DRSKWRPLNMTNSRSKRHAANDLSEKFATEPSCDGATPNASAISVTDDPAALARSTNARFSVQLHSLRCRTGPGTC
ncbi:hypothetical protein, partial [Mesorhizobium sp. LSHC440B00]|uniref:hypothetical protein n=1 Tax=Mesorhizobium sp. LSHC440B00 TaxID=1287308 RepID=UPI001FDA0D85